MKTIITILIVLGVAIGIGLIYMAFADGVKVEVATARYDRIRQFVDEQAKTRLPKTHLVTMPYSGRIAEIQVNVGDPVSQGQEVATIIREDLDLELRVAQARVDELEASIEENRDNSVEDTTHSQALKYVASMDHTVEAADTRVQSGKARLNFARDNLDREEQLLGEKLSSREKFDEVKLRHLESDFDNKQDELMSSALKSMQAATALLPTVVQQYISRKSLQTNVLRQQQAAAKAQLEQAENNRQRGVMKSPVSGKVLERSMRDERYLAAGTVLLEIGALDDLEIEAEILSQDVVHVREGNTVDLYGPAIGEKAVSGVVAQIYPAGFTKVSSLGVEQQRVRVIIRLAEKDLKKLLAEQHLGVGYRVRARIFTKDNARALVIPRSGLFRGAGGQWQVFAVRGGRAQLQNVDVGLMNDEFVEITKGLKDEEQVVLAPETNLEHNTKVTVVLATGERGLED